ncbi:hypothetical protein EGT74_24535 [Chitinophaga lutea]|uniref:DUF3168 domain-containing protein n=1 Tax=Chitinophaga lutea TaxID=2488634 RepID=A0A3N4Q1C3_9BACT|nr:hypothetical protein [Chitinophaga lutea]RPE05554.1 hypothetical protein EGT74_24535 [Chitinophaga lutea]
MRTTLDVVDIVWQWLNASPLKAAITGGIYKYRPQNSTSEDVVINSLPITGEQVQEGVVNVNIHVPNPILNSNGTQDQSQANHPRLKELASIAVESLTDIWVESAEVNFTVQNQMVFPEPDNNEHYVNIRLSFISVNL